jgi:hypothetical protein
LLVELRRMAKWRARERETESYSSLQASSEPLRKLDEMTALLSRPSLQAPETAKATHTVQLSIFTATKKPD